MEECPICYELCPDYTTKCGHKFHKECLDMWLDKHYTCPMCRYMINNTFILWSSNNIFFRIKYKIIIYDHYFIISNIFSKQYISGNNIKLVELNNKNIRLEVRIKNKLQIIKLYSNKETLNSCFNGITYLIDKFSSVYLPYI